MEVKKFALFYRVKGGERMIELFGDKNELMDRASSLASMGLPVTAFEDDGTGRFVFMETFRM